MKIAVDAMGGDHAPEAVVEGALLAKPQYPVGLVLIGDESLLRKFLGHTKEALTIEVVHAPETIGMGEAGPVAIRKKRDASLGVAMRLLATGEVDAVVSAGNSSAVVATAKHFVGLVPGLRRPAMAVPIPTNSGKVLLVDAGAHAEANTIHLAQSAALAHAYLKVSEGLALPRVGLLNIGREPQKGMKVIQKAFSLLQRSPLHFVGNIEPQDIFADTTDAAICDGFVGNLLLKMYEGLSETLLQFFDMQLAADEDDTRSRLHQILQRFQNVHHYQNVGGAPLLGVKQTVVVAHGRSRGPAISGAIRLAIQLVKDRVYERMAEEMERDCGLAELKHQNTLLMLEHFKSKWGFAQK
jgi:phosphate acyltransferase